MYRGRNVNIMKYCSKCGVSNDDGAIFCTACGEKFAANNFPPQQYQQYQQDYQNLSPADGSALKLLKNCGKSQLFFSSAVVYSAMILFQVINILNPNSSVIKYLNYISQTSSTTSSEALSTVSNMLYAIQIILGIISLTLPVLIGVGIWLIYFAAKDDSHTGVKTTGLSVIKIAAIINLVFLCIVMGIIFIFSLFVIIAAAAASHNSSDTAVFVAVFIFMFLIYAGIAAFFIIYYAKIISTIKAVVYTAETGKYDKRISVFVPIVNIISAVSSLIGVAVLAFIIPFVNNIIQQAVNQYSYFDFYYSYGNRTELPLFPGVDIITVCTMLLSTAFLFIISIVILQYRTKIDKLTYSTYNAYTPNIPSMSNISNNISNISTTAQIPAKPPQLQQLQQPAIPSKQRESQNNSPFIPPENPKN